ncbi:MAG: choice-of-anchor U domain-containing protein [Ilumatobacteraceae bacterium]
MTSLIRSLVVGVVVTLSALSTNTASAEGLEGDVEVAAIVVTASGPSGVVPGNTIQTITVTVRNDLPQPIPAARVVLAGIDNAGPQTVAVPAFTSRDVTFDVVPCRSGTTTVTPTVSAVVDSRSLVANGDPVTLRVASGSSCITTLPIPGGTLSMTTTAGRVSGMTAIPLAGLPTPPPGMNLPYGAISFTIEDLDVGASVTVRITTPGPATNYAKLTASGWVMVPGTVTIGNDVAVTLVDGGIGDADGLANGRIVDPGAVVAPTQVPPPTNTTPSTTVAPAVATTVPATSTSVASRPTPLPTSPTVASQPGGLPRTGGDVGRLIVTAVALVAVGGAVVVIVRQRRRARP